MSSEHSSDVKFEIGHVLFIDIVGYSKMFITDQSEQLQTLKQIVRGTEQFRLAEAEGKLLRLPTGDGGALVFRTSPEAPVLCAIEISRELKRHPELRVRMGIHSGPVRCLREDQCGPARPHDAVSCVYDEVSNVIETSEHKSDFKDW